MGLPQIFGQTFPIRGTGKHQLHVYSSTMNQLDAVASESYQLQPATLEHQETETKEQDLTEPEKCNSETETLPKDFPETERSELPPASEVSLNEPQSDEEDKFSDFDP